MEGRRDMPASPRAELDHAASARDGARRYLADGYAPVPLRYKVPWDARRAGPLEPWQTLRLTPPELETYFAGGVTGVGNILGPPSAGATDVDLDCPEALAAAGTFLPETGCIFGRPSAPQSHRIYVTDDALDTVRFKDVDAARTTLLELRSGGAQTVFPPSLHESGELVTFAADGAPARVPGAELRAAVAPLAPPTLPAPH